MVCKICGSKVRPHTSAIVLRKYEVAYFQCLHCEFIQTEEPYWLNEAYSQAISTLDVGLIHRNEVSAGIAQGIIHKWFNRGGSFVDYGGGYGILVRMMRDRGYDFYRYDLHCQNLFAQDFEVEYAGASHSFELVTAFEVVEHLTDPIADLQKMLSYGSSVLLSTELQPFPQAKPATWPYFVPETGQHIGLYSRKSFQILARQHRLQFYEGNNNIHLLTARSISPGLFKFLTNWRGSVLYNTFARTRRPSLVDQDAAKARQKLVAEKRP